VANDNWRCARAAALLKPRAPFQAVQLVEGAVDCRFNLSCLWREIRKATGREHTKRGAPQWRSSGCLGTKRTSCHFGFCGGDGVGTRAEAACMWGDGRGRSVFLPGPDCLRSVNRSSRDRSRTYLLRCITLIAGGPIPSALP
jgi:hypothetical protein